MFKKTNRLIHICCVATSIVLGLITSAFSQSAKQISDQKINDNQPIPIDKQVRVGKLPNGLTYYIRRNTEPKNRVIFYLANKVGSILENEDQRGLAHFVEHMNFNGTKHFPHNEVVNYLQKAGVRFGADINAYTNFDETVYQLPLPADDPKLLKEGIQILRDWAQDATLDSMEIEKERGVVLEEKRLHKGVSERMSAQYTPFLYNNSRYADRMTIGLESIIENFKPATIRSFYKDWYRPDLQAVIIVGDIDVAAMERDVRQKFSDLKNPINERKRVKYNIPLTGKSGYMMVTDKDAASGSVEIYYRHPGLKLITGADYRVSMIKDFFNSMIGKRYSIMDEKQPDDEFGGGSGYEQFLGGLDQYTLSVSAKPKYLEKGFEAVWKEQERVKRDGFTQQELDNAKASKLEKIQEILAQGNYISSSDYIEDYLQNFLYGVPSPGPKGEYALIKKYLPLITLADVNAFGRKQMQGTDKRILVLGPDKEKANLPDESTINNWIKIADANPLGKFIPDSTPKTLLTDKIKDGRIVDEKYDKSLNVTTLMLSNGVKVLLKPTAFEKDQIDFSGVTPGGTSLYPDSDYMSAQYASQIISSGGIGGLNALQLNSFLMHKNLSVQPYLSERVQEINGTSDNRNLENALKLMFAYYTEPRKDSVKFRKFITDLKNEVINKGNIPEAAFDDTIRSITGGHRFRRLPLSLELIDQIKLNKVFTIYQQRFGNVSGSTFTFVGDFDAGKIKPLILKYVGGLPSSGIIDTAKNLGVYMPAGVISQTVRKGIEDKASVYLVWSGPFKYNLKDVYAMSALKDILEIRLIQRLREDESGVYSPGSALRTEKFPNPLFSLRVTFGCSPANAEKLIASTNEEVSKMVAYPPSDENVEKWHAAYLRTMELNLKDNRWWLDYLSSQTQDREDLHEVLDYKQISNGITAQIIHQAAQKYLMGKNYIQIILLPNTKAIN